MINQSVEKSMISDVPISVASVVGLDSSILQVLAKQKNSKINLVSWIFQDSKFLNKAHRRIKKTKIKQQILY